MKQKSSGFSIIEVALVLGIAGLIFIMAFIALPSLWTSQRDADRKARVMEFINDVKTYQTNNSRGALPTLSGSVPEVHRWSDIANVTSYSSNDWVGFIKDYVTKDFNDSTGTKDTDFKDPTSTKYTFYIIECMKNATQKADVGTACAYGPNNGINNDEEPPKQVNGLANVNNSLENKVDYTIYVVVGGICEGDQIVKASNNRSVAALQVLERAGRYCHNT